jgi:predicted MPP superfamily phosphohydrolase
VNPRARPWGASRLAAIVFGVTLAAGLLPLGWMYHVATSDPVVRTTSVTVPRLTTPLRLLLASDIHVAGPDMPPARVRRMAERINALHPDIILLAGDFVSDKRVSTHRYPVADTIAPLALLRPTLGTVAVLGNHEHWRDADGARRELRRSGIDVIDNDARRLGPLTIGGIDDLFTHHDNLEATLARMRAAPEPRILLTHSPDIFPKVPGDVVLTLAGHTHCGQIRIPVLRALVTMSAYGDRYACGRIDEQGRTLIVTAGLGTSLLPLRFGAVPDVWVVELRPGVTP